MSKSKEKSQPVDSQQEQPSPQLPSVRRTWAVAQDAAPETWPTNLDLATLEGRIALANAGRVADWIPRDGGKFTIVARWFVIYPDSSTDPETGEHYEYSRVCLIAKDGTMAKFSSKFGPSAMRRYALLFRPEEWEQGIIFECEAKRSNRSGRTYGDFRVVGVFKPTE